MKRHPLSERYPLSERFQISETSVTVTPLDDYSEPGDVVKSYAEFLSNIDRLQMIHWKEGSSRQTILVHKENTHTED